MTQVKRPENDTSLKVSQKPGTVVLVVKSILRAEAATCSVS